MRPPTAHTLLISFIAAAVSGSVVTGGGEEGQRLTSLLRDVVDNDALQPYWVPFGDMMLEGAPRKQRGESGVLVVPVPVVESSDAATKPEMWRDSGTQAQCPSDALPAEPPAPIPLDLASPIVSSKESMKEFRKQIESTPYEYEGSDMEAVLEPEESRKPLAFDTKPPTPLTFPRPLALKGELYVRYVKLKTQFTVWEGADGAAVTEMQDGATIGYRVPQPGRQMKLKLIQVDRSWGGETWNCSETPSFSTASDEVLRRHPLLPDVSQFQFVGYTRVGDLRAEVWRWQRTGGPGELAAAPDEVLTFRHEMLVTRSDNQTAMPLKYSVHADSSVLGRQSDGYEIRYSQVTSRTPPAFDLDSARCDSVTTLSPTNGTHLAKLEPLREYTRPDRDPRYDAMIAKYILEYKRNYTDSTEEAIRKNLMIWTSRFVEDFNRRGNFYAVALSKLGDRLQSELNLLYGVQLDLSPLPAEPFPYSKDKLKELAKDLPLEFDWRQHKGVTPVRVQGNCNSCWAITVTGAVEGARFIHTKKLQRLAEQALVDCAQPFGANGCDRTWPEHGYEYIVERGLPDQSVYRPYVGKVMKCPEKIQKLVGTRISGYVNVPENVEAIKVAIRLFAPVVVLIDANTTEFNLYDRGVFNNSPCHRELKELNHAVLAVGWNNEQNQTNLIVKNSLDTNWGDGGYMTIKASENTCGILVRPSYPVLDVQDILEDTENLEL